MQLRNLIVLCSLGKQWLSFPVTHAQGNSITEGASVNRGSVPCHLHWRIEHFSFRFFCTGHTRTHVFSAEKEKRALARLPRAEGVSLPVSMLLNLSGELLTAKTRFLRLILNVRGEMLALLGPARHFLLAFHAASVLVFVSAWIHSSIHTQKHLHLQMCQSISLYASPAAECLTKMWDWDTSSLEDRTGFPTKELLGGYLSFFTFSFSPPYVICYNPCSQARREMIAASSAATAQSCWSSDYSKV